MVDPSTDLEQAFADLVSKWKRNTGFLSLVQQKAMDPSYQRIIGLGERAVPLLLRELREDPSHWFWALNAITGEDPAVGTTTIDAATAAWLEWGTKRDICYRNHPP